MDLKCSPLSISQDMGRHLQAHLDFLRHYLQTIQSFGQHLTPPPHPDNLLAHLGDPPLASLWNDFCPLRNCRGLMLQGLRICLHYMGFPMTNRTQSMRAAISRTWAGPNAKPESAWSERNVPWSNLPKAWGSPTWVPSTNGKKYGWLGLLGSRIGPLSGNITFWNSWKMDPWTGRWRSQIIWSLSSPGSLCKISIM